MILLANVNQIHQLQISDTELGNALWEYTELKKQAAKFDLDELLDARLALRPDIERSAVSRAQSAYGKHYDILRMYDSKRDVSNPLNEDAELRAAENADGSGRN